MFSYIKNTFSDVFLLYKSFLNWNAKKIIIYIWSYIFAFLVALPFLWLLFWISYLFWVDIKFLFSTLLNNELTSNIYINLSFFFITFIFFFSVFYRYILLNKINFDYLKSKKTKIKDNYYFDFKIIKKYFVISFINISFLLGLSLIFLLFFVILYFLFWWFEWIQILIATWTNNVFSIISLIIFIIFVISFIYFIFRLIFSYYILSDHKNKKLSSFECIKKSILITKWYKKIFKLFSLIVIFSIFLIPSFVLISFFNNNMVNINNYFTYTYWIDEEQKNQITNSYTESLELEFNSYTVDELNSLYKIYWYYILWINIINFVLFFWMFSMIWTSFYKRELLKDN